MVSGGTFKDFNIAEPVSYNGSGDGYTTCPECSGSRRNKKAKCLSVNNQKGVWKCHHCGWAGSLRGGTEQKAVKRKIIRRPVYDRGLPSAEAVVMFEERGIPEWTLISEKIKTGKVYMPQVEDFVETIQFPYLKGGTVVNVKYRTLEGKHFRQEGDAEKVFYRQDSIEKDCVVIVEGEIDALSCVVAGIPSCVSVPDGAPAPNSKNYASKFDFLDQDEDPLGLVEKIVLALDNDDPGEVLKQELGRRLGRDRCWLVKWPESCKDANDVLKNKGPEELKRCIDNAEPWPVEDAVYVDELVDDVMRIIQTGLPRGLSTGFPQLDEVFSIGEGQVTVFTGIPSHGKSGVVDALAVKLMKGHGWRFVICSPEHFPTALHATSLLEKWTGKSVRRSRYEVHVVNGLERNIRVDVPDHLKITPKEIGESLQEMHDSYSFIVPTDAMKIPDLLERATYFVKRRGIQGLIVDPWNEFDHQRGSGQTEAEYTNAMLGLVRRWARKWSVHVFIVAHPTKMIKREDGMYPVPTLYDINGGAAWRNKVENGISVYRVIDAQTEEERNKVELHIQKVKWRNQGEMGRVASLVFNSWTGCYS